MKPAVAMTVALLSLCVAIVGAFRLFAPEILSAIWPGVTFVESNRLPVGLIAVFGGLLSAWSNWRWFKDSLNEPDF